MKVQIVGGPRDGEVLDAPNGAHEICFPAYDLQQQMIDAFQSPHPEAVTMKVLTLPIQRYVQGGFFVLWRKP